MKLSFVKQDVVKEDIHNMKCNQVVETDLLL